MLNLTVYIYLKPSANKLTINSGYKLSIELCRDSYNQL